ncbi:MAG: 8-amino-7-oxononanoate synthase [Nitrospira sp.]|jgi:8-amino-7-oxononanoate synthase|nr:8-amino-7-oxononanoate synthase [Nitrospira sp.]
MFHNRLQDLADQSLMRRLRPLGSATGPTVTLGGRTVILLASNDYLGLATHPEVIRAAIQATEHYGTGAGASRLVCGTLPPHEQLETALAAFKHTPSALAFGSGYLANLGIIPALIGKGGLILADRLCHASLIDGCRLSGADFRIYRHKDLDHLESLLKRRTANRPILIVTDGLFSMDGDLAPLPELAALATRFGAMLYVDDAHGTGVMGPSGRGTLEQFGVEHQIPFHMGTLGKALGSSGAYIAGSANLVQYLINTCKPFIFTTAPPPSAAAAATAALAVIQNDPARRARLWENRERLYMGLRRIGFRLTETVSPILPILVGEADKALAFAEHLLTRGVYAPAIRPPTVPEATSRIRVTVTSEHTAEHLDTALAAFEQAGTAAGIL